jgi:hypothetical protein
MSIKLDKEINKIAEGILKIKEFDILSDFSYHNLPAFKIRTALETAYMMGVMEGKYNKDICLK